MKKCPKPSENHSKPSEKVRNGPKWSETVRIGPKTSETVGNGLKALSSAKVTETSVHLAIAIFYPTISFYFYVKKVFFLRKK